MVGLRIAYVDGTKENKVYKIEYDDSPYGEAVVDIASILRNIPLVVGFNLKHDLAWLKRYGINLSGACRVFDCQLAEFILDYQRTPFPSLDGCCAQYGLPRKLSIVHDQYWALGIDTTGVPLEILIQYNEGDLVSTDELYHVLENRIQDSQRTLLHLHMQDLLVLLEMEHNGLCFDWDAMAALAAETRIKLDGINQEILSFVASGFRDCFNPGSGQHLSALLYGGVIKTKSSTEVAHTYKVGAKAGTTVTRRQWTDREHLFPRLVEPKEGTQLDDERYWSTAADTLKELHVTKESKPLVEALLQRAALEKLNGTYLEGIPETAKEKAWEDGLVHGQYNQCRVVTGRLSSSSPNQQNRPPEMDQFVVSRYNESSI